MHKIRHRSSSFTALAAVPLLSTLFLIGLGPAGTLSSSRAAELASSPAARSSLTGEAARQQAKRSGIDLGRVIETVGHRVFPGTRGRLVAEDRLYRAHFDGAGFALTLRAKPSRNDLAMTKAGANRPERLRPPARRSRRVVANRFQHRPAFRLETSAVGRGGRLLPTAATPWRSHSNQARRQLASGLEERVTAREGRLEWGLRLADAPVGSGAFTIRARVDAADAPTRLARKAGWRYSLGMGRSARVSAFVVRDARGHALYRALPAANGRLLTLTVPEQVLRGAAYPLTIAPTVHIEYPAGERPLTLGDEYAPQVAFDGTNYLVVWQDYRPGGGGVYGARVTSVGTVLDPNGIRISPSYAYDPAVAFDGTNYLVVWDEYRSGPSDIYGARVNPAGNVLDPNGIAISTAANYQATPALAFDGTNYLVVWADNRSGTDYDVWGARVSTGGTVLDLNGIAITTVANSPYGWPGPAVAFGDTNYLVVWTDYRSDAAGDVYGARVSPGGTVLDPNGIAIAATTGYQAGPAVAFDRTNFLVVWAGSGGQGYGVYGTRVSPNGTVLDPNGIRIASTSGYAPAVAFDGTNYLVVWYDYRSGTGSDIYGARVSPAGTVLDPSGIAISTAADYQYDPAVAVDDTNYLVVWADGRSGTSYDIFGARVSPAGTVLDPSGIAITPLSNDQYEPALAFDGTNYLVVWQDNRSTTQTDIYGARVTPAGTVLDPSGIAISTASDYQYSPAVAYDSGNYLVVWEDRRSGTTKDVYGARVSPAGMVLDPAGIAISTAAGDQQSPAVAFGDANYLVVWQDYRPSSGIYGARVSPAGVVLDLNGIRISPSYGYEPAVAFDGTNYVVVWDEYRPGTSSDIYGARVSQAGVVLDPTGIAISAAADYQEASAIAFDGTNYLVVWQDYRLNGGIYGARVSPAGVVLDANGIRISPSYGYAPAVAFDQTNYLVVWQAYHMDADIEGARVSPAGTVLDPSGFVISITARDQRLPALAFDGTNYIVGWSDARSGTSWDVYGARVRPTGTLLDPNGVLISDGTPDTTPPETTIDSGPSGPTNDPTPTFAFSANENATFECRIDAGAFVACTSPHTTAPLADGAHSFQVRAIDVAGNADPTPANRSFEVDTTGPETTIDSGPSGETSDPTPTFTFSANESASFQCRVDVGAFAACSSPHTTETLATGSHTFEVRAVDGLGNVDPTPAARSFTIAQPPPPPPPPTVKCRVPAVIGLRLSVARSRIRRAHCRVGRVRSRHGVRPRKVGRVVAQQPRPRTVLPRGGRVRLVVGRR